MIVQRKIERINFFILFTSQNQIYTSNFPKCFNLNFVKNNLQSKKDKNPLKTKQNLKCVLIL